MSRYWVTHTHTHTHQSTSRTCLHRSPKYQTDLHCCFIVWQPHRAADTSTNGRQNFLCCRSQRGTASCRQTSNCCRTTDAGRGDFTASLARNRSVIRHFNNYYADNAAGTRVTCLHAVKLEFNGTETDTDTDTDIRDAPIV